MNPVDGNITQVVESHVKLLDLFTLSNFSLTETYSTNLSKSFLYLHAKSLWYLLKDNVIHGWLHPHSDSSTVDSPTSSLFASKFIHNFSLCNVEYMIILNWKRPQLILTQLNSTDLNKLQFHGKYIAIVSKYCVCCLSTD